MLPLAGVATPAHAPRLLAGVVLAALALAYAYGLNAISDRATDLDGTKNPLAGAADCPRSVARLVAACAVLALALGLALSRLPLGAVAVSLLASTLYSAGPRWKALPAVGTLLNAAIFAPLLFTACTGPLPPSLPLQATTFCALLLQNQLLHEQADQLEDRAARVRTTASVVGTRVTLALVVLFACAGTAAAWCLAPMAGLTPSGTLLAPSGTAWLSHAGTAALAPSVTTTASWLAPASAAALAATLTLWAGAAVALVGPRAFATRRLAHRAIAFAGGACVFVLARGW